MIRFGILGLGNIAHRFAQSAKLNSDIVIVQVASSSLEKGQAFCETYGIEHYTQNYDLVISNPDVDVIYIAVPHGRHAQLVEQCLLAGKAVLCEKPLALNAQQVQHLIDIATSKKVFLMEAVKGYFLEGRNQLKKELANGIIGKPFYLEANFDSCVPFQKGKYLFEKEQGGALLDVGIYPLSFALDMFDGEPVLNQSKMVIQNGIDTYFQALIDFPEGQSCLIEGSIDRAKERLAVIEGTKGTLEIPYYYRCKEFTSICNGEKHQWQGTFDGDDMSGEIAEVVSCLNEGRLESTLHPLSQSLKLAKLMDEIREKAVRFDAS